MCVCVCVCVYTNELLMLVCKLPEDGGVPPKHVAVNKNCIVKYIGTYVCCFYKLNFFLHTVLFL